MPRRGKGACRGRTPSRIPSRSRQTPKRRGRPPTARVPRAAGASKTDVCLRQRGEVFEEAGTPVAVEIPRLRAVIRVSSNRATRRPREKARRTLVVTESLSSEARVVRRHDGCDDATSRAGGARGDIRGDRVVATAARAPQRASVDVVVLHLASAGPAPDSHEEVGAGARRTHALALARRERGRETTGEPSAHALPRRTRACALARRTRALALARRALALARGRAAFRDGREGCFLPGGRRRELAAPRNAFTHRARSRAVRVPPQSPAGARRGPRPVSFRGRVHGGRRGRHVRGGGAGPGRAARRRARAARGAHRDPLIRGIPVPVPVPILRGLRHRRRARREVVHRRASVRGRRGRRRPAADARLRRDQKHARDVRRDARGRARARAAVLCRARRGRGGGARDGRGGSTLPRGRGGGPPE